MEQRRVRIIIASLAVAAVAAFTLLLLSKGEKPAAPGIGAPAKPVRPAFKGRIAIVLDDLGYTDANFGLLAQIRLPLTLSVLPNLPYSAQAGERLHRRFRIILHLPMEPRRTSGLEKDTILTTMDAKQISGIISRALAGLKYARGVSNHMGSRATEDQATMNLVFDELKKRRLFFLDSFVTPRSVCAGAARQKRLRWARRDVFLDNQLNPEYIRKQLWLLKKKAASKGSAIGIGHDRRATIEVLREEMPRLAEEGYQFVFVSDLLN